MEMGHKPKITSPGIEPSIFAGKQKCRRLSKPAGGFEPPTNHQVGFKPTLEREISFDTLSTTKSVKTTRASLQTGPGGLAAPNGSRATSSNATNELGGSHQLINDYCWSSCSSPDPHATLQPTHKFNATSPTDVMKHHLMEDVPVSPSNQTNPVKEDPQAFETLTMPETANCFIGSRSDEQPLSQKFAPDNNSPTQKQVQTAKQPQPQMIKQNIISRQSTFSNMTNHQMKPDKPNPDPRAFPIHELSNQSPNPSPENFLSTQSKILGTTFPVLKNSSPFPKYL
ncbi:hypothetical protein DSO57_1035655 [Entomophthora muscae]|uniref:Uncharacterized protein n=1 Tax=Entomophthora muscae TaxID=34485 RepID=A0ACC2TAE9_9FUNG|nr:hypothetical protein DSO57_1035655 [Entomophthora muscae]